MTQTLVVAPSAASAASTLPTVAVPVPKTLWERFIYATDRWAGTFPQRGVVIFVIADMAGTAIALYNTNNLLGGILAVHGVVMFLLLHPLEKSVTETDWRDRTKLLDKVGDRFKEGVEMTKQAIGHAEEAKIRGEDRFLELQKINQQLQDNLAARIDIERRLTEYIAKLEAENKRFSETASGSVVHLQLHQEAYQKFLAEFQTSIHTSLSHFQAVSGTSASSATAPGVHESLTTIAAKVDTFVLQQTSAPMLEAVRREAAQLAEKQLEMQFLMLKQERLVCQVSRAMGVGLGLEENEPRAAEAPAADRGDAKRAVAEGAGAAAPAGAVAIPIKELPAAAVADDGDDDDEEDTGRCVIC
ncbi:MAG: hypothetical protein H0X51_04500 [Parachlamydiaceae bacterium]|nr:hypothetical protein [Parachlamydiaceae bacterium]